VKPGRLRPLAESDLLDIARQYRAAGGEELSARFREAARTALRSIEQTPGLGSPVIGNVCDVPGLRARRIKGYPYRWFYFVRVHELDVVRLLGDAQDLVSILGSDDET
jgi:toxin ParE1/3/4